jgi:hypothetical protein
VLGNDQGIELKSPKLTPAQLSRGISDDKGKKRINEAVMTDPDNVEIRLVRLSVQIKSPSFLGYKSNIDEDKKFIRANHKNIKSAVLKEMMAVLI